MAKKLALTVFVLILVVAILGGTKYAQIATMIAAGKTAVQPSDAVTTFAAKSEQWRPVVRAVGTVTAMQGVMVSAQMSGNVAKIAFEAGAIVQQGDLLLQLDTSVEEAQLRSAEAGVALSRMNLDRARDLLKKNSISQSELDVADAQFKQTSAQADNFRAVIAKKTIRAPFSGRLGLRLVNLGQTLREGDRIVSLQSLDPVYVDFFLPQQNLASAAVGQEVTVVSDADPVSQQGRVTAIGAEVEVATRNIKLQATLANKDGMLRPGMFVNVSIFQNVSRDVIVVPVTAIIYAAYGNSVFVVEKAAQGDGFVAKQHFVSLGETRGDFVEITKGVDANADVVTSGAFKLRSGASVIIDNTRAPAASLDPKPTNS